uniref:Interleukin 5 receptor subunit alpha n=1 Tax=Coturnix japonica TaxID=93934 RepID=A0A8C2U8P5_COTJA
ITMRVCLILLWIRIVVQPHILQCKAVQVFPPVNLTLTVSALAQVLLSWKPSPDQEQKNYTIRYDVKILTPLFEEYDTMKTHSFRTAVLHNGFSAHVRTLLLHKGLQVTSDWVTAELQPPPGAENTAVTGLSCVTHFTVSSTVSLHCTWLPGEGAPEDTEYFLFYRYETYTEECLDYIKDKWNRNTEGRFSVTHIAPGEIDELIVIHINGSSKYAAIKPFQQLFNQNAIEKVNVPRNVTVFFEQDDLVATWEKPLSAFPEGCFEYEIYLINLKSGNKQVSKTYLHDFRLRIDVTCRYSIQIRANHHMCSVSGFWSDWSEIVYIGKYYMHHSSVPSRPSVSPSHRQHMWSKLFPPIPTPRIKFRDPFPNHYERARSCASETWLEPGSLAEGLPCSDLHNNVF